MQRCLPCWEFSFPVHWTVTAIKLQTVLHKPPDGEDNWPVVTKHLARCDLVMQQWNWINCSSFYCHCMKTWPCISLHHRLVLFSHGGALHVFMCLYRSRSCAGRSGLHLTCQLYFHRSLCTQGQSPRAKSKNRQCFMLSKVSNIGT